MNGNAESKGTILLHEDGIYAVCPFERGGRRYLAGASEQRGGGCTVVPLDEPGSAAPVWKGCGGTMKLCGDGKGGLLGIQNFFMGTTADDTKIVHCVSDGGAWRSETVLAMPCLHNLTVVQRGAEAYLVFATLCERRSDGNDWSRPGSIYAARITDGVLEPRPILAGLTKNHGFMHTAFSGRETILVSGSEGAFAIGLPDAAGSWPVEQLLHTEISDLCACDLDGDGLDEIGAFEGFHGELFTVYHKTQTGYAPVYSVPVTFGHPIYGGRGRMVAGSRKGEGELFTVTYKSGGYFTARMAEGLHASSLCEAQWLGQAGLVAACKNGDAVFYPFPD